MMKAVKRFVAVLVTAAMLVTPCVTAEASAYVSMSWNSSYDVADGVTCTSYEVYGSQSGHSETATVLEFHPDDGYIPMAFAASAGNCNVLSSQYSTAVNKYGYEVAGVINGSYFDMETGTLSGMLISGGKVSCADIGYTYGNLTSVVAFGYDGSMNVVDSQLAYHLYINGNLVPDALRFINKNQSSDGWRTDAIYYYDTSCGTVADSSTSGYEVICRKVNGTDLSVGETMVAEVVQVNSNTYGTKFETNTNLVSDYFVLTTGRYSSYAGYLSGLRAGDMVEISVEETIEASKSIMENASSAITNVGWLVKDGVDMTDYNYSIGEHSVTGTYARWTAFGQKADGTYVFFTSEGGDTGNSSRSLTLKDVAAAMMDLGCVNVIRMDGGGSTAMYVSDTGWGSAGYVMSHSRAVADCILVVKNNSGKPGLKSAIKAAESISHYDYTEETLSVIREAYEDAKAVYASAYSDEEDYAAAAKRLNALLAKTGPSSSSDTEQEPFWLTHYNNTDAEGAGAVMTSTYSGGAWNLHVAFSPVSGTNAYIITAISDGTGDGNGRPLGIPNGGFVYTINTGNDWPTICAANPGAYPWATDLPDYTSDSCTDMMERALDWKVGDTFVFSGLDLAGQKIPTSTASTKWYSTSYICTATMAEYKKVTAEEDDRVKDGIYITGFNSPVAAGDSIIFTSEFNGGWISTVAANHSWTQNVVLNWEKSVGSYVVTNTFPGEGDTTETIYLGSNQIMIATHDNGDAASSTNKALLEDVKVGQKLEVYGLDIESCKLSVAPYVRFVGEGETAPEEPEEPELPVEPEEPEVPEDTTDADGDGIPDRYGVTTDENGNYSFENAYGYVFDVDDVNGVIEGEDATLVTSASSYSACNPNWAISVELAPVGGNNYQVEKVAVTPGSVAGAGITWNAGTMVLVVHSASSRPGDYANWMSKVAAMALQPGDILTVSADKNIITVISAGEPVDADGDGIPDDCGVSVDSDGNYSFDNAYGYIFDIDDVNGTIDGEDATIVTSASYYNNCNPNWAISVELAAMGNTNEYEVVKVVVTPGSAAAAGITWDAGDIVLVVHSASSRPGDYANWMSKVAAMALNTGDVVTVSEDCSYVVVNK